MRNVRIVTRGAYKNFALHDQRRETQVVAELHVRYLNIPDFISIPRVQADQVRIGSSEVDAVLVVGDAAMSNVVSLRRASKLPYPLTRSRVHGPHMIWAL